MQGLPRVPTRPQPEPLVLCTVLRAVGLVSSLRRLIRRGNPFIGEGRGWGSFQPGGSHPGLPPPCDSGRVHRQSRAAWRCLLLGAQVPRAPE